MLDGWSRKLGDDQDETGDYPEGVRANVLEAFVIEVSRIRVSSERSGSEMLRDC